MRMTPRIAGAFGRLGFRAYSPRHAPGPMPPLGGNDYRIPDPVGLDTWEVDYTTTTGHVFVRVVWKSSGATANNLQCSYGGVAMTKIVQTSRSGTDMIYAACFGVRAAPIGTAKVKFTLSAGAGGVAAVRIGECRELDAVWQGLTSEYGNTGGSNGNATAITDSHPGIPFGGASGCVARGPKVLRPMRVTPNDVARSGTVVNRDLAVIEVDSTDGLFRLVAAFPTGMTALNPTISNNTRYQTAFTTSWQSGAYAYTGCMSEINGLIL